jgi:hypothetical protein
MSYSFALETKHRHCIPQHAKLEKTSQTELYDTPFFQEDEYILVLSL